MGKYIPPTPAEIHAWGIGFLDAHNKEEKFETALKDALEQFEDVRNERHYYRFGYGVRNQWKASLTILSGSGIGIAKILGAL